jgi:hypothetical protein
MIASKMVVTRLAGLAAGREAPVSVAREDDRGGTVNRDLMGRVRNNDTNFRGSQ